MALDLNKFSPVGGFSTGNLTGFGSFIVASGPDNLAAVQAAGFFNNVRDQIFTNDYIFVGANLDVENPDLREFAILSALNVPRSPSTANVTVKTVDIKAT